jgi:glycosyltransferase involved in cell wall biosynthesis
MSTQNADLPGSRTAVDEAGAALPFGREPRIGVLVVAYNAASTLVATLDRLPSTFRERVADVFVCDDASQDDTYLVGVEYQKVTEDMPVTVVRHNKNLGYGGNQKAGYRLAAEHDLDIIVLLHADGQYAPEAIEEIIAPLESGEADAVFGSRMMVRGDALKGGMPLYKYVGNRILTTFENQVLDTNLSEFHSGYRAYNVHALNDMDLTGTDDGFNFDTQIIIALVDHGKRIAEVPIPTFYGDEICYVDGMKYAKDVTKDVLVYRLARKGFTSGALARVSEDHTRDKMDEASFDALLKAVKDAAPRRVLFFGEDLRLADLWRADGIEVVTMAGAFAEGASVDSDEFRRLRMEATQGNGFDVVVMADVISRVKSIEVLMGQVRDVVSPEGLVIGSVPNFGHWYARSRVLFGAFGYDQRGILDRDHVRFYTLASFTRAVKKAGFDIVAQAATGLPMDILRPGHSRFRALLKQVDDGLVRGRSTLFAYQFIVTLRPTARRESITFDKHAG